jgi:hypothetical protein
VYETYRSRHPLPHKAPALLAAHAEAGLTDVTVVETLGIGRQPDELPPLKINQIVPKVMEDLT